MTQLMIGLPKLMPMPGGAAYLLSFVWMFAVIVSGVAEAFCFLYLAGIHVPSESVPLSKVAIIALMVLI
jgi:hypothetical protein